MKRGTTRGVQHPLGDLNTAMGRLALKRAVAANARWTTSPAMHEDPQAMPGVPRVIDGAPQTGDGEVVVRERLGGVLKYYHRSDDRSAA